MPSVEVSHRDIEKLLGEQLSQDQLRRLVAIAKCSVESVEGDLVKLEVKDTNRPDLWSAEGIAREIKLRTRKPGLPAYRTFKSKVKVIVDSSVKDVRPFTTCAIVTELQMNQAGLSQMIQLQEKVASSYGAGRREVAIGVYDLKRITPPIRYTTVDPDGIRFVPLDLEEELTPREILHRHPKGREFGHLLAGARKYPMFVDSSGEVMSIPPIINSNFSGKVTEDTRRVFIECSGFSQDRLSGALNVLSTALAERGGSIGQVEVRYPGRAIVTPDLRPRRARLSLSRFRQISDLNVSVKEAYRLLEKSGYKVTRRKNDRIEVMYPAHRQDIMHERDLMEDVLISYGYDLIKPERPRLPTVGELSDVERFSESVSSVMTGLGFQQVMSYMLTNEVNLFSKMNLSGQPVIELENPVSSSWTKFRNWLLPSVMEFLSHNTHADYPQRIFEVGDSILPDAKEETKAVDRRKLACAIAGADVGYQDISSALDALLYALGTRYELQAVSHPAFIQGRVANIIDQGKSIGVVGEIDPGVLEMWKLEVPVSAFEIDLTYLIEGLA